jgi:2-amino-4-hydroxy-6-hydroxymethyldihydropteridine diphosphokinase
MNNALTPALIAFGGNLGDPIVTLRRALPMLNEGVGGIVKISSLYETRALTLHGEEHPHYINAVIEVWSWLEPEGILEELLRIERELGRDRSPDRRWEPRTIDLDLLFVSDAVVHSPPLTLPHPEIAKRDFVVAPLAEIVPDFVHPVSGKRMIVLASELRESGAEQFVLRTLPFEWRE